MTWENAYNSNIQAFINYILCQTHRQNRNCDYNCVTTIVTKKALLRREKRIRRANALGRFVLTERSEAVFLREHML